MFLLNFGEVGRTAMCLVALFFLSSCDWFDDEEEEESNVDISGIVGCYVAELRASGAGEIGCGLVQTSGDFNFDVAFNQEIGLQNNFFLTNTPVYVFDECSAQYANALSSPQGFILYGINLIRKVVFQTGSTLPVAGIMAHEFGHQIQFRNGWMDAGAPTVRNSELEADAISGLYVALNKSWSGASLQSYFDVLFSLGDYNFADRSHHGTPLQRYAAGAVGIEIAIGILQNNSRPTWVDVHNVILIKVNEIVINPALIGIDGDSVSRELSLSDTARLLYESIDHDLISGIAVGARKLSEIPAPDIDTDYNLFPY